MILAPEVTKGRKETMAPEETKGRQESAETRETQEPLVSKGFRDHLGLKEQEYV